MADNKPCKCRNCGKHYDPYKSRADYTGYCSAACLHAKAKSLGYKKGKTVGEYEILRRAGQVGNINHFGDKCDFIGRKVAVRKKYLNDPKPKKYKYTSARQVGGDDGYCWAVFLNGREMVNGLTRPEVNSYRDQFEREEEQRRNPPATVPNSAQEAPILP